MYYKFFSNGNRMQMDFCETWESGKHGWGGEWRVNMSMILMHHFRNIIVTQIVIGKIHNLLPKTVNPSVHQIRDSFSRENSLYLVFAPIRKWILHLTCILFKVVVLFFLFCFLAFTLNNLFFIIVGIGRIKDGDALYLFFFK